MSIYERPTKALMKDFANERLHPGQVFVKRDAVEWFAKHYSKIRSTTVKMHVEGMAVNSSLRRHHPNIRPGSGHDLFFKVAPGRFRLWDPDTDSKPLYNSPASASERALYIDPVIEDTDEGEDAEPAVELAREFAFERDLRNYLAKNLPALEPGMKLYVDEDKEFTGIEYPVGGRFIDILAVDSVGALVVIELKVSRGYERTIGQLLRYMAWVRKNLADGKRVRGMIVASDLSEDLRLAASLIADVSLFEYQLALTLKAIPRADSAHIELYPACAK